MRVRDLSDYVDEFLAEDVEREVAPTQDDINALLR